MNKLDNFTEKYFKKIVVSGSITIGALLCVFLLIVKTDVVDAVSSTWKDEVVIKANTSIAVTGQETVDELLAKGIDTSSIEQNLNDYIKEQEALLEKLLREYYDAKLNNLTSDYDLEALKAQIDNIRANLLIEYKKQIDLALIS